MQGFGNTRAELSIETVGIPVIAIGVPTLVLFPNDFNFIVTPKEIDELIQNMSKLIAYGINMSL